MSNTRFFRLSCRSFAQNSGCEWGGLKKVLTPEGHYLRRSWNVELILRPSSRYWGGYYCYGYIYNCFHVTGGFIEMPVRTAAEPVILLAHHVAWNTPRTEWL
jgi:hypothetical protein